LETSTPCRHRTPRAPAAAGARANLQTTRESSGCGEGDRTTQLAAQRILGPAAAGGTVAAVVEPGGVGEYGSVDELPREDGSGGGEIPEVGEEYHHLRSNERAHKYTVSERSMCSNPQQTRGTTVASDERRGTTALPEGTSAGRTAAAASILRHGGDLVVAWWAPAVAVAWTRVVERNGVISG